jgi:hypothetical protein
MRFGPETCGEGLRVVRASWLSSAAVSLYRTIQPVAFRGTAEHKDLSVGRGSTPATGTNEAQRSRPGRDGNE